MRTQARPWGFLTRGECWHNNDHAYPESARMQLEPDQLDSGWWVLMQMQHRGPVSLINTPGAAERCEDLVVNAGGKVGLEAANESVG